MSIMYLIVDISYIIGTEKQLAYLCCKLQTGQSLAEMRLKRTDHDEHERLGITTQRKLKQVCQLEMIVSQAQVALSLETLRSQEALTLLLR